MTNNVFNIINKMAPAVKAVVVAFQPVPVALKNNRASEATLPFKTGGSFRKSTASASMQNFSTKSEIGKIMNDSCDGNGWEKLTKKWSWQKISKFQRIHHVFVTRDLETGKVLECAEKWKKFTSFAVRQTVKTNNHSLPLLLLLVIVVICITGVIVRIAIVILITAIRFTVAFVSWFLASIFGILRIGRKETR